MKDLVRIGLFALAVASVSAQASVINTTDRGWYSRSAADGNPVESFQNNLNYLAGWAPIASPTMGEFRNYFSFDLSSYTGQAFSSATLALYNPKYGDVGTVSDTNNPNKVGGFVQKAPNAFPYETYQLHDVTTSSSALLGGTAGLAGFNDLGRGAVFGSYDATLADNGSYIRILLNDDGLKALNESIGGTFIIGGSVITLKGDPGSQTVFGFSNANNLADTFLEIEVAKAVPEPATLTLFASGLALLGLSDRRKQKKSKVA